jgi:hypothetical protein
MEQKKSKYGVGHKVYIDGLTSLASGGGYDIIKEVGVRYNTMTGDPFHIYKIGDKWWDEDGCCHSNPKYMYEVHYDVSQDVVVEGIDEEENEIRKILYSEEFDDHDKVSFLKDILKY